MTGKFFNKKGFSLIEMLIVVTILGVISLSAVPVAEISFIRLKETEFEDNLNKIRAALQNWRRDAQVATEKQVTSRSALIDLPEEKLFPPSLYDLIKPEPGGYTIGWTSPVDGPQTVTFYPKPYLSEIPQDPFVGGVEWIQYYAKGTGSTIYTGGPVAPPVNHEGVFDISANPDPTARKGFVTAMDGTNYADW
jgi:general secretion pathway protein G